MKRAIVLAAASMMAACGGGGGGGGVKGSSSVNGTVSGSTPQLGSAVSGSATINAGTGSSGSAAVIILSNDGQLCADAAANKQPKNAEALALVLADTNSTTGQTVAPVAAGDYQVYANTSTGTPPAKVALVSFERTDATCKAQPTRSALGASGVVHLTSVSASGVYSGSFDITVAETDASGNPTSTTDHLTGSFSPAACSSLNAALSSNSTVACY